MIEAIFVITLVYGYFYGKKIQDSTEVDGELTKSEKIQVIVMLLVNTLAAMVFYDIGWRKKLPIKAKQVNKYVWRLVWVFVGLGILGIVATIILVAISARYGASSF